MARGIGSYKWTQTLFQPGMEALETFKKDVLAIWLKPSTEKQEGALRLAFKVEWTTKDNGAKVNEKVLLKDRGAMLRDVTNPLKDYLK